LCTGSRQSATCSTEPTPRGPAFLQTTRPARKQPQTAESAPTPPPDGPRPARWFRAHEVARSLKRLRRGQSAAQPASGQPEPLRARTTVRAHAAPRGNYRSGLQGVDSETTKQCGPASRPAIGHPARHRRYLGTARRIPSGRVPETLRPALRRRLEGHGRAPRVTWLQPDAAPRRPSPPARRISSTSHSRSRGTAWRHRVPRARERAG
jgi:hypothetical protein